LVCGLASKQLGQVTWFGIKTKVNDLSVVWPQNRWLRVSRFGPQNRQLQFDDFGLKITTTVSWFGFKTKRATIYLLRHKTDERIKTA
jgi:hypothetical protein